jgi:two-component system sensor histidine kinase SenX3
LEQVTGQAAEVVSESSEESIRFRKVLDSLEQGVLICDVNGQVVFRNNLAMSLMGGRHGDAIVAQGIVDLLQAAWKKGSEERTIDLYGPPKRSLVLRAQVIDDGRKSLGVIAIIEDVTERHRIDEIRRDFVTNVSHELKTPISALGLLAETLVDEEDATVAKRLASRIQKEAFRVSRIIDDLLDLSRIEAEESPQREPVEIGLIVADSVERLRSTAEQKGIAIDQTEAQEVVVLGDRRQLASAVYNLAENAIKFSDTGSRVAISVRRSPDNPSEAEIHITDHGIGIPAKDLERIFERFYRVDISRSHKAGGTGLGLSIVRHAVSNHGGRIEVDSREGQGSTFKIILPILYSDEEPPDTNEPTDPHELQAPLQPAEPSHTPAAEAPESPNTPEPFDLQLHGLPDIHESPDSHPYGPETYEQFDPQLHELQPTEPPEIPAAKQYDQENGIQDI